MVVAHRKLILVIGSKEQKTVCLLSSHILLSNFGLGCFKCSEERVCQESVFLMVVTWFLGLMGMCCSLKIRSVALLIDCSDGMCVSLIYTLLVLLPAT